MSKKSRRYDHSKNKEMGREENINNGNYYYQQQPPQQQQQMGINTELVNNLISAFAGMNKEKKNVDSNNPNSDDKVENQSGQIKDELQTAVEVLRKANKEELMEILMTLMNKK